MGETEHRAFLLFWIHQFFMCTSLIAVVGEFAPYVLAILNQSYLNIGALFLSLLYKGIFAIIFRMKKGKSIKSVFGPFCFLQLWMQQYFLEFFAEATLNCIIQMAVYGDCYTRFSFLSLLAYEVANILVKMRVRTFMQLCLYQDQDCGSAWIRKRLLSASDSELSQVTLQWSNVLTAHDILNGVKPRSRYNHTSLEPYNP